MATACYPVHRQPSSARVHISGDGELLVQCGTQDMGSGTYTVLGQMAADGLGVPIADVTVELGDTWLPEGPYSGGSMVTLSILPAVEAATRGLRAQLAELAVSDEASPLAGLPVEDVAFADGLVRSRSGNAAEPLIELLRRRAPGGLEAEGSAAPPEAPDVSGMGYGAVFVEVGVDPDLGEVRVRRVTAAYAAGRILNPLLARSQHVGGLIGGIGMALHERTVTDRATGRILGDGFADYLIPVHADMPAFDIALIDEDDPHLPGGVKGIGMLGSAGVQAAIANAVHDAIGRRIRHLPIRIEDVMG
jgi:xanthine dehydrogenase YagR molybdenum-binding subunit